MFIPLQKNDGYTVILKDGHFPEIWQLWQTHRLAQGIATGEKEPSTPQEARLAGLRVASRCLELPLGHHTGGLIRNGSRVRRLWGAHPGTKIIEQCVGGSPRPLVGWRKQGRVEEDVELWYRPNQGHMWGGAPERDAVCLCGKECINLWQLLERGLC